MLPKNKAVQVKKECDQPFVLWLTGLSGSGKSTLADKVYGYIEDKNFKIERLDGDVVRALFPNTGFSKEDRDNHIKRVGLLASMLERNGVVVIASFISPYTEARKYVRNLCKNFIEVYVKATLEACEKRDTKGPYKKARQGEIKQFTGIDDPYEKPISAEITVETDNETEEESFLTIIENIDKMLD